MVAVRDYQIPGTNYYAKMPVINYNASTIIPVVSGTAEATLSDSVKGATAAAVNGTVVERLSEKAANKLIAPTQAATNNFARLGTIGQTLQHISNGANAITYNTLIDHVKAGGSLLKFNWKGLLKGRCLEHVDHVTAMASGTVKNIARGLACTIGKFLILMGSLKSAKAAYQIAESKGDSKGMSAAKAGGTFIKEIAKAYTTWEAAIFGSTLAARALPGLGSVSAIGGAVAGSSMMGYVLNKLSPTPKIAPKEEPSKVA